MMKKEIKHLLHKLHILPFTNADWTQFEFNLSPNSSKSELSDVKKKIREQVPEGIGGVYILAKGETILYIGESEETIRYRLIRHIDKVKVRTDSRSDFFKMQQHHGLLTVYFMPLSEDRIGLRRTIEDMLTILLEPEYKKWELRNKIIEFESNYSSLSTK